MPPAARCRSESARPDASRVPVLPPGARSAARNLEQLQREAQASDVGASPQSCSSPEEMGSREDHAQELGPRGFIDPVVTAQPVSPSSLTEGMPVIHLSSVPPVSSSSQVPGVDPPSCARPMGSVEGHPNPLFEAAEAVLRATLILLP